MEVRAWRMLGVLMILWGSPAAQPLQPAEVPQALRDWIPWVLHDEKTLACTYLNDARQPQCIWPGMLELSLGDSGGYFQQTWEVLAEAWLPLPGEAKRWPQEVRLNGEPATVIARGGHPHVWATAGQQRLEGRFEWAALPQSLHVPPGSGLVSLRVAGTPVKFPLFSPGGDLWVQDPSQAGAVEQTDRLDVRVFRSVIDDIPMQLVTRLQLDVSGVQREVVFEKALADAFLPLALTSALPSRLEADGRLRLQVRPGAWALTLVSRSLGPVDTLRLASRAAPWPAEEVWVFDARNQLRLVEVSGGQDIDPRQATLPSEWSGLPAYRMRAGDALSFSVRRRGDPDPEPNRLALERTLWLDFTGEGFTVRDNISGTMTQGWRLDAQPGMALGQVMIDGIPQFITRVAGHQSEGVEVRHGILSLQADSRYGGDVGAVNIVGWDEDFHHVQATLNLPPGWRLLHVSGVDNKPNTWLQRWTLLDLFLVLIAAIATGRLFGWLWLPVALVTLAVLWHEPLAPRYVWLNILAASALLRVVPDGRFQQLVTGYRYLSLLALVVIAIPFMVNEVRVAIYPQLERPWQGALPPVPTDAVRRDVAGKVEGAALPAPYADSAEHERSAAPRVPAAAPLAREAQAPGYRSLNEIDPDARLQTGPGLPQWRWTQIPLQWNGPVDRTQQLVLTYLSPTMNFGLNLARVLLLVLLTWRLARRSPAVPAVPRAALGFGALLLIPLLASSPGDVQAGMPSAELLGQLKERLSAAPECLPECVDVARTALHVEPSLMTMRMEVHARVDIAVPVPGKAGEWQPQQILVDGAQASGAWRDKQGVLWVPVEAGTHRLDLAGPLPGRDTLQIVFPLPPHRVTAQAQGWAIEGLGEDGVIERQLQLTRRDRTADTEATLEPWITPAFLRVERTLHLGLEWGVSTRVSRLSPPGSPVVMGVPLLDGESVLSEGVSVEGGKVRVNLSPGQQHFEWRSAFAKEADIRLTAPASEDWVEVWRLDVSPVWHVSSAGIPVIHHQGQGAVWFPTWRPWPGESVALAITRPEGVGGQTLTVDQATLRVAPGRRNTDASFEMVLRSTQGGQHAVQLPPGVTLQGVKINGTPQPIRMQGNTVTLPVTPGTTQVQMDWRAGTGIEAMFRTPPVDLATTAVNAQIQVQIGPDRWILFTGGPRLGPAVLYWGVLIVVALVAVALGRLAWTPLRTWHWLLLGIGLSQSDIIAALIVVGWLLALGTRDKWLRAESATAYDFAQIILVLWTFLALSSLYDAVRHGLLGYPEMQIVGNASTATQLNWYQDRIESSYPQAWVYSVPLWAYRAAMLAWALWLALALLNWLKWGWQRLSEGGLWRPIPLRSTWRKGGDTPDVDA